MRSLDLERVKANVRDADTEDLLDRATVYREGMEPDARTIIMAELYRRGVTDSEIDEHGERRQQDMLPPREDGSVIQCDFCRRPAVQTLPGWYRLWGVLPIWRVQLHYCVEHAPDVRNTPPESWIDE